MVQARNGSIKVLTNFGDGRPSYGIESSVKDYAKLSADVTGISIPCDDDEEIKLISGDLPTEFSICSSVLIKYVTTNQYFYQFYNVGYSVLTFYYKTRATSSFVFLGSFIDSFILE